MLSQTDETVFEVFTQLNGDFVGLELGSTSSWQVISGKIKSVFDREYISSREIQVKNYPSAPYAEHVLAVVRNDELHILPCRPLPLFKPNGQCNILDETLHLYVHSSGKEWAIENAFSPRFVLYKNPNTGNKYVYNEVKSGFDPQSKINEKLLKGYVLKRSNYIFNADKHELLEFHF